MLQENFIVMDFYTTSPLNQTSLVDSCRIARTSSRCAGNHNASKGDAAEAAYCPGICLQSVNS